MKTPLRVLQLEDNPTDAELITATLAEGGIPCEADRVETRADFLAALKRGGYDMILADYSLPSFDGISALAIARELRPDIPFIFVSATLGEELAIDTMLRGATDYILKQRLGRLVPSVQRASARWVSEWNVSGPRRPCGRANGSSARHKKWKPSGGWPEGWRTISTTS